MTTTAMPRGRLSTVRHKRQADFVSPQSGSGFAQTNTYGFTMNRSRSLEGDDVQGEAGLNNTIDDRPSAPAPEDASISATFPLDLNQIGYRLAELLGAVTPTGSGPYTHAFISSSTQVPTTTFEQSLGSGSHRVAESAVMRRLVFTGGSGPGFRSVTAEYLARKIRQASGTSIATSPSVVALANRVPNFRSELRLDGVKMGSLIDWTLTLENQIESDRYDGDEFLSAAWKAGFSATLEGTCRYVNDVAANLGDVVGGALLPTPHQFVAEYALSPTNYLSLNLPAVRVEPTNVPAENGGALTFRFRGRAEVSAGAPLLAATLVNNAAGGYG